MCNISDKRDNVRVLKNSYFPGMQFKGSSNIDLKKGNEQNDYMERNNKTTNSFLKKSSDITTEKKVTSVVKSSKVGGATDNEETAHFVFFDMED
jgi:hypothetical protein